VLSIDLGTVEYYNPDTQEFEYEHKGVVRFQYTLKILYEWEGRWQKAFLDRNVDLTAEEIIDLYLRMAVDPIEASDLTEPVMKQIAEYIASPLTATRFRTVEGKGTTAKSGKVYTSEEIYALMFQAGIPIEFENKNLNRLMVILRIISNNNAPPKKMSRNDILRQNAKINAARKARLNTRG